MCAAEDFGWADICILLEGLADGEAEAPEGDVVGDVGGTDGAEEDGVVFLEGVKPTVWDVFAGLLEGLRGPVVVFEPEVEGAGGGGQLL